MGAGNDSLSYQLSDSDLTGRGILNAALGEGDDTASIVVQGVKGEATINVNGDAGSDRMQFRAMGDVGLRGRANFKLDGGAGNDTIQGDLQGDYLGTATYRGLGGAGADNLQLSVITTGAGRTLRTLLDGGTENDQLSMDYGSSSAIIGTDWHRLLGVDGGLGQDRYTGPDDVIVQRVENVSAPNRWQAEVDALVQPLLTQYPQLGISIGVINPNGQEEAFVYGLSGQSTQKVTDRTAYEAGPATWLFTSLLLADMVARGEVGLNDSANNYVPSGVTLPNHGTNPITLLELATHTSGLPATLPGYQSFDWALMQQALAQLTLPTDADVPPANSELGMAILGAVLANRAGKSLEALLRERVFGPLGLSDTFIEITTARTNQVAVGHSLDGTAVPATSAGIFAGGSGIRTTVLDFLRLLQAQRSTGVSALSSAILSTQQSREADDNPATTAIESLGLGWLLRTENSVVRLSQNGRNAGFQSAIEINRATGAGFVVLANRLDDATAGAIQSVINALRTKIVTPSNPEPTTSVLASIGTNFNGSILTVTTPNQASDLKFNYDDTLNVLTVEAKVGNGSTLVRRYATDLIRELRINTGSSDDQVRFDTTGHLVIPLKMSVNTGEGNDLVDIKVAGNTDALRAIFDLTVLTGTGVDDVNLTAGFIDRAGQLKFLSRLGDGNDTFDLQISSDDVLRGRLQASVFGEAGDDDLISLLADDIARGGSVGVQLYGGLGTDQVRQTASVKIDGQFTTELSGGENDDEVYANVAGMNGTGVVVIQVLGNANDDSLYINPPTDANRRRFARLDMSLDGGSGTDTTNGATIRQLRMELSDGTLPT